MSVSFVKNMSSPIVMEIEKELQHYEEAKQAGAEITILEAIQNRIKLLQGVLTEREKQKKKIRRSSQIAK